MQTLPLQAWLIVAAILFSLGLYGALARRNAIAVLMGLELMFAAANLNLLAFWRYKWVQSLEAPVFVTVIILVAACETALALAIVLGVFRRFRNVDIEDVGGMRG
ncbi:MAG: NADH-quinone oxidoreductase subunit NuoK [Fimbriimonadales bacterium]|nr:NADH-quinone oxidoreductase subunit NuoK [Fimbriimonadales bacterium]